MNKEIFFDIGSSYLGQQFGLWQPVLDRFLITVNDKDSALQIGLLASSKYKLLTCNLSSATNHNENLIDNLCCENWTLSNKRHINFTELDSHGKIIEVENLISTDPLSKNPDNFNIEQEKNWLQFCKFFLDFLKNLKYYRQDGYMYDRFIKKIKSTPMLDNDYFDHIEQTEIFILKTLYHEWNMDICFDTIENYINTIDPTISNFWQIWVQTRSGNHS